MLCGIASSINVQFAYVQTNVAVQQATCLYALYAWQGMDAYEYADPTGILSELGKEFWDMLAAKKWSERRDALAKLRTLASAPKLASGDYGDVNRYPYNAPTAMQAHKKLLASWFTVGSVLHLLLDGSVPIWLHGLLSRKDKKRKDYAFQRQVNEKPSIIPGCPRMACSLRHITSSNFVPSSPYLWH